MNKLDLMGREALGRVEDMINASRLNDLLKKHEEPEKKVPRVVWVLAIIGAVAAVYRYFTPDYLDDFEDDFDDDFDDDFFDDDTEDASKEEPAGEAKPDAE